MELPNCPKDTAKSGEPDEDLPSLFHEKGRQTHSVPFNVSTASKANDSCVHVTCMYMLSVKYLFLQHAKDTARARKTPRLPKILPARKFLTCPKSDSGGVGSVLSFFFCGRAFDNLGQEVNFPAG